MQPKLTIHSVGVKLEITAYLDLETRGYWPRLIESELTTDLQKIGLDTSKCQLKYDLVRIEKTDFEAEIREVENAD